MDGDQQLPDEEADEAQQQDGPGHRHQHDQGVGTLRALWERRERPNVFIQTDIQFHRCSPASRTARQFGVCRCTKVSVAGPSVAAVVWRMMCSSERSILLDAHTFHTYAGDTGCNDVQEHTVLWILKKMCTGNSYSTWLLYHVQDGFAAFVLVILEVLHAVVLIFVRAIHRVAVVQNCATQGKRNRRRRNHFKAWEVHL